MAMTMNKWFILTKNYNHGHILNICTTGIQTYLTYRGHKCHHHSVSSLFIPLPWFLTIYIPLDTWPSHAGAEGWNEFVGSYDSFRRHTTQRLGVAGTLSLCRVLKSRRQTTFLVYRLGHCVLTKRGPGRHLRQNAFYSWATEATEVTKPTHLSLSRLKSQCLYAKSIPISSMTEDSIHPVPAHITGGSRG